MRLGVTAFAGQIAVLVLAPFGGLWADRVRAEKLLVVMQAAAAVPAFTARDAAWLDVIGCGTSSAWPCARCHHRHRPRRSGSRFFPKWCRRGEDLPSAVAFNSGMYNAARMIGPTIAGVLLAVSTEAFCFPVNGATKLAAVVPCC
jgi:MFS family permease